MSQKKLKKQIKVKTNKKKPVKVTADKKIKDTKKPVKMTADKKIKDTKKPVKKLKTPDKKNKLTEEKKLLEIKAQSAKKSSVKKKQNLIAKAKSKSLVAKLNYREKELQKLLDQEKEEKLILKDMEGRTYCLVENCDYPALVEDYCRIHFFGLFKMIKRKKQIIEQDILTKSYRSLVSKYSPAVFEHLFKDISSDKDFKLAIKKFTDEEADDLEAEETFSD